MSPDDLPANMRAKIALELPPVATVPGLCWAWQNAKQSRGYGSVAIGGSRTGLAHRVSYELLIGPIPANLQLDHLCTNKPCINPEHLEPVTAKVNCERTDQARKEICINGHRLEGKNLVIKKRGAGRTTVRNCRRCQVDSQRRFRAARKLAAA